MSKLFKLSEKFYKIAQNRRIVYDRSGLRPRPTETIEEISESSKSTKLPGDFIDPGGRWDGDIPEYTAEDFENFHIPSDLLDYELQKSYTPYDIEPKETAYKIDPEQLKQKKERERQERLEQMQQSNLDIEKNKKIKENPLYLKMLEKEKARRESLLKSKDEKESTRQQYIAQMRELKELAMKREPWKYFKDNSGEIVERHPDDAKELKEKLKHEPWKYIVDEDGTISKRPEGEQPAAQHEIEIRRKERQKQRAEENKRKREEQKDRDPWDFSEVPEEVRAGRKAAFEQSDDKHLAKALSESVKDIKNILNKLGVEVTLKNPGAPRKGRTEKDTTTITQRDETGRLTKRTVSVDRPGEQLEDWITVPVRVLSVQSPEKASERQRKAHIKLNVGTRSPGKRKEYEEYVGKKVQELYDALFKLASIKHKYLL